MPLFVPAGEVAADEVRGRALAAAEMLGNLHRVDASSAGGRAVAVEVSRWRHPFGTVTTSEDTGRRPEERMRS